MLADKHTTILPSFGRRRGHKLHKSRDVLMETLLPKLLIHLPAETFQPDTLFKRTAPLWFEIGFGGGEHLAAQARENPHVNFIGCEPYVNGMATLLAEIEKHKLDNIRLYSDDARSLLKKMPDHCIERLFVLFPDPWPKNRHHKRRIISQASLALFYKKLQSDGLLRIATDHIDYCTWILEQGLAFKKLQWTAKQQSDWQEPPLDWVPTRYQAKALAQGRVATFLDWKPS